MKGIIAEMNEDGAKGVLLMVVEKQPAIMFDILDRVDPQDPSGFHLQPGSTAPPGCRCGNCREMPSIPERICCGRSPQHCISTHEDMDRYILDEGVLSIAHLHRQEVLVYPEEADLNKANRHTAYRQFTLWYRGRLGAGVRVVIPSCCVWTIRDKFPDPFSQYTGFIANRVG